MLEIEDKWRRFRNVSKFVVYLLNYEEFREYNPIKANPLENWKGSDSKLDYELKIKSRDFQKEMKEANEIAKSMKLMKFYDIVWADPEIKSHGEILKDLDKFGKKSSTGSENSTTTETNGNMNMEI